MPLFSGTAHLSVAAWEYRDPGLAIAEPEDPVALTPPLPPPLRFSEDEVQLRLHAAVAAADAKWSAERDQQSALLESTLAKQMQAFLTQRATYFESAEVEVAQLVLGIARKILQREAALDPALLRGLVHVALSRLHADAPVRLRVPPASLPIWKRAQARDDCSPRLELLGDETLAGDECVLESGSASASLSVEVQLKEIEKSFHDLMAHRPGLNRA